MIAYLQPIRERIAEISANDAYLSRVLKEGKEKARMSAAQTLNEVRNAIGIRPF
jgi:tryptophanyl-tRNA synthetase